MMDVRNERVNWKEKEEYKGNKKVKIKVEEG
jgi:hypothetical protein